jgi:hypothetical protein
MFVLTEAFVSTMAGLPLWQKLLGLEVWSFRPTYGLVKPNFSGEKNGRFLGLCFAVLGLPKRFV